MNKIISDVTIKKVSGDELVVACPYSDDFRVRARQIGGNYKRPRRLWVFDPRDEERVRDLTLDVYGTDGRESDPVDVRLTLRGRTGDVVFFAGRKVAERRGRDWAVKLGQGVVLIDGKFPRRGGSAKYPAILDHGLLAVIEVRGVPYHLAVLEQDKAPDDVEIVGADAMGDGEPVTITIVLPGALASAMRAIDPTASAADLVRAAIEAMVDEAGTGGQAR